MNTNTYNKLVRGNVEIIQSNICYAIHFQSITYFSGSPVAVSFTIFKFTPKLRRLKPENASSHINDIQLQTCHTCCFNNTAAQHHKVQPYCGLSYEQQQQQDSCLLTAVDAAPPWQITKGGLLSEKQMFSEDLAHPNPPVCARKYPKPQEQTKKAPHTESETSGHWVEIPMSMLTSYSDSMQQTEAQQHWTMWLMRRTLLKTEIIHVSLLFSNTQKNIPINTHKCYLDKVHRRKFAFTPLKHSSPWPHTATGSAAQARWPD